MITYLVESFVDDVQRNIVGKIRDEAFDGDDVDALCELVKIELNLANGNSTSAEYEKKLHRWKDRHLWRFAGNDEYHAFKSGSH